VFLPTLARHIIEPLWASAMAAPVPRVSEHARALIRRSARFRSEPSEPNSYWTVVDAGLSGAHAFRLQADCQRLAYFICGEGRQRRITQRALGRLTSGAV